MLEEMQVFQEPWNGSVTVVPVTGWIPSVLHDKGKQCPCSNLHCILSGFLSHRRLRQ